MHGATLVLIDVLPEHHDDTTLLEAFHALIAAIPSGYLVALHCGDLESSAAIQFTADRKQLLPQLRFRPVLDPEATASVLLSFIKSTGTFGFSCVLFNSQSKGDFKSRLFGPIESTFALVKNFEVPFVGEDASEAVLSFVRKTFASTEIRISAGDIQSSWNLLPTPACLNLRSMGIFEFSHTWQAVGEVAAQPSSYCQLRFQLAPAATDAIGSVVQRYVQSFASLEQPKALQVKDGHGNLGVIDCDSARNLRFSILTHYNRGLLTVAGEQTPHRPFPVYNGETIRLLGERLLKFAMIEDEASFLKHLSRLESFVRCFKKISLIDELEEQLLLNGVDRRFAELLLDIKARTLTM